MRAPLSPTVTQVSRLGLAFGRRGSGPTVVLVHGWCLNRTLWTYLEEQLVSVGLEVITPDLAGFGESAHLAGPYDLDRHAADVADLLDELEIADAVLVGFAFGAAVLMSLPRWHRVRSVALIGVPSAATSPYDRFPRAMRRDWPDFAAKSARAICRQPQSEATLAWLERMFGATRLPVALETVSVLGSFEPVPMAHQVPVPAVLVHGEHDDVVPVSVALKCAARMSDARVEVVEQSGHLVVLDQKEHLAELVSAIAAGQDRARVPAQAVPMTLGGGG
jgi:non-heme chloroperoxidase